MRAARVADHRDLEERLTHAHLLPDGPVVHVRALDGDVLANRPWLHVERVEVLLRREENLAAWPVGMGTAVEPIVRDRGHALARLRAAAAASRRDEEPGDGCHRRSLSI